MAITPLILVVPPDSPPKTVKELIEMARAKPGALNYSSAGLGSTTGIAGALFRQTTKTDIVHVAFKGLPETHTAIIRGDVALGLLVLLRQPAISFRAARCVRCESPAPIA